LSITGLDPKNIEGDEAAPLNIAAALYFRLDAQVISLPVGEAEVTPKVLIYLCFI